MQNAGTSSSLLFCYLVECGTVTVRTRFKLLSAEKYFSIIINILVHNPDADIDNLTENITVLRKWQTMLNDTFYALLDLLNRL